MATSMDPKGGFKQDMVVSTRYRNDLPPPPMPPKLLDIDNGGLAQYLTTSFASAMARREEPNIEVDAEGGMPIDMIGIPGYFLGDESAIMAPEIQPVLDPADHALMLTPDQLRNQNSKNVNVSFLRKTQYMTSQNARANDGFMRPTTARSKSISKSTSSALDPSLSRDDPINIKRHIQRGFDIAYPSSDQQSTSGITSAELNAWRTPTHPDNPKLKPVSYYPLLPDLEATTDTNGYISVKFDKPPLAALPHTNTRDGRIDVALMHATVIATAEESWQRKKEMFEKNPELYEDPGPQPYEWDFCIPKRSGREVVEAVKRKLDPVNPNRDDEEGYQGLYEVGDPRPGQDVGIDYVKERSFGAVSIEYPNLNSDMLRMMAVSLWDPETAGQHSRLKSEDAPTAAYYYPITQRVRVKADRGKVGPQGRNAGDGGEIWNHVKLRVRDPTGEERVVRAQFRDEIDDTFKEEYERIQREAEEEETGDAEDGDEAEHDGDGDTDRQMARTRVEDDDDDDVEMGDPPPDGPAKTGTNGFVEHDMQDDD